ncbi:hypothetical protein Golob_018247 [Gossypium lobatum]|uniref:Secreted protein n=1 Tax=Gossypium lobatum TaxID=34289 RepID=A0A7J8M9N3_9ROSI|nr:hypothetical protein [Gossypium lobatum]
MATHVLLILSFRIHLFTLLLPLRNFSTSSAGKINQLVWNLPLGWCLRRQLRLPPCRVRRQPRQRMTMGWRSGRRCTGNRGCYIQ